MRKSANTPAVESTPKAATKRRQSKKAAKAAEAPQAEPAKEVAEPAVEDAPEQAEEQQPAAKVIQVKLTASGRWYVFYRGIKPSENVGCGCKTAASAMKYCRLLKQRDKAYIPDEVYQMLKSGSAQQA